MTAVSTATATKRRQQPSGPGPLLSAAEPAPPRLAVPLTARLEAALRESADRIGVSWVEVIHRGVDLYHQVVTGGTPMDPVREIRTDVRRHRRRWPRRSWFWSVAAMQNGVPVWTVDGGAEWTSAAAVRAAEQQRADIARYLGWPA